MFYNPAMEVTSIHNISENLFVCQKIILVTSNYIWCVLKTDHFSNQSLAFMRLSLVPTIRMNKVKNTWLFWNISSAILLTFNFLLSLLLKLIMHSTEFDIIQFFFFFVIICKTRNPILHHFGNILSFLNNSYLFLFILFYTQL